MKTQRILVIPLLLAALGTLAHAQVSVAPPPHPLDSAAPRDSRTDALQDELNRLPRVSWQETTTNTATNVTTPPAAAWEEVATAKISAAECKASLGWKDSSGNNTGVPSEFFLEMYDSVGVLPADQLATQWHPGTQYVMSPEPYSVYVKMREQNDGFDFKVADRATAERIAASFRQLIGKCNARAPRSLPGPTLNETLDYVRGQIVALSTISTLVSRRDVVANTAGAPLPYTLQISQASTYPMDCLISYQQRTTFGTTPATTAFNYLSLRRITKLTVLSAEDWDKSMFAQQAHPELVNAYSIPLWVVVIKGEMGTMALVVPDEDTGDHIAKGLLHAVELCGGGSKPLF